MPQLGLEVTEGTVAAILVDVGALVGEGDPLLELETDKAMTDVVAPRAGTVARIEVEVGDTIPVGATLVLLADEHGEQLAVAATVGESVAPVRKENGRVRSAPVARRAAQRLGIELSTLTGTGPRGRITLEDVERAAADRVAQPTPAERELVGGGPGAGGPGAGGAGAALTPLTGVRRAIARRMTASQAIPQFSLRRELDATALLAAKERLPASAHDAPKSSINDMLVQALGELVLRHPELASSYVEDESGAAMLARRVGADVGLAVASDRGLMVPVIRRAHESSLRELARERVRLVGAAHSGRLTVEQMSGATVTLSNLGGFGVDGFVAMLNPGEAAILAVGRTVERVVPRGRGIAIVPTLSLSLSVDHRVMDGATGAAILLDLVELLEGAMPWRP